MARYIDAEALTDYMLERYNDLCEKHGDYDHYTTGYGDAIDVIEVAPTADVVPKSEVEELKKGQISILPDGKIELLPRSDVKALKKEVAWEIFEAIYKSVASKIPMEIRPIFKDDRDFDAGFINGKRDALLDVLVLVAELKKKYTEDNNDG